MDPGWRRQRSRVRAQGCELGSAGPSSQPLPQPSKGQIHRLTSQRQQLAPKGGCGRNFSPTASSGARELISHEGKPERGTKEAGEAAGGLREPRPGCARGPRDATPGPGSPWSSPRGIWVPQPLPNLLPELPQGRGALVRGVLSKLPGYRQVYPRKRGI